MRIPRPLAVLVAVAAVLGAPLVLAACSNLTQQADASVVLVAPD